MRITQNAMTRNYVNNLNTTLGRYNDCSNKVLTGRQFTKVSDDVSAGVRALKLRTRIAHNEQNQDTFKMADEFLTIAEDNMTDIVDVISTVHENAIKGQNDTNATEHEVFATTLESYADTILKFMNATYNDHYVFGGTNCGSQPYTVSDNGTLLFNGEEISTFSSKVSGAGSSDVKYYLPDGSLVPESSKIYLDVGNGVITYGDEIEKRSVLQMSVNSLSAFGYGTTTVDYTNENGVSFSYDDVSNNIYDIIMDMAQAFRDGDMDKVAALDTHLMDQRDEVLLEISDIGVRTNYISARLSKLEDENTMLQTLQTNLEGIDDAEEISNLSTYKYAWELTLKYGSNVIPQTLMSYIS